MTTPLRLFGSELSPYSVKVRSYLRYKGIPHEWVNRSMDTMEEFQRYAKLPLIPLVVTPEGRGLQDSTPIIEHFEALRPEPSIHPADPALAFLSALLEEYGDEWGNKAMFHYRWTYEPDQRSSARRIAEGMQPAADAATVETLADAVRTRMVPRLSFVGSSPATRERIEASFRCEIALLERHLAMRPYLFGGRPAFADFGVFAQLYEALTDPTPGAILRAETPRVVGWIERMLDPVADGAFESWDALGPTLEPLLREEVAARFLPWSDANARALAAGERTFTVTIDGAPFTQETQKYHAKSLAVLRRRLAGMGDRRAVDPILERTGCLARLREDAG
jgi:glutathione S-transferase